MNVEKTQHQHKQLNIPIDGSTTPPPRPHLVELKRRRVDEQLGATFPRYHDQEQVNKIPAGFEQPPPDPSRSWSQAASTSTNKTNKKQLIIRSDTGELSVFQC